MHSFYLNKYSRTSNEVTYFDSFRIKDIPKEIKKFIGNRNITTNIFRIQAYASVMANTFILDLFIFLLSIPSKY